MNLTYEKNGDYLIPTLQADIQPEGTVTKLSLIHIWKKWSYDNLPIIPQEWQHEVKSDTKAQYQILKKLMHDDRVDAVAVSYTHLDVYKRQGLYCTAGV